MWDTLINTGEIKMAEIFVVMTLARQLEGDFVFLQSNKAFKTASKADALVKKLTQDYQTNGKYKPKKLTTDSGNATCYLTAGAFTMEIED